VRYLHTILHRAFRDAVRWRRLPFNPADAADPPSASAAKAPEMKVWTKDELRRFLELMEGDRYQPAFLFLATTGCRRGEAVGLRWSDVNLDAGLVSIRQTLTDSGFKHRTKTGKARVIELDARTVAALRSWKAAQAQERLLLGAGYQDHNLVFCLADGRPYVPKHFAREFLRRLGRKPFRDELPRIRMHDLRHTWATLALIAGIDVKIVSERLGHSSPMVTWSIYQHVVQGMQTDAAERVASLIFGPTVTNL
jgi:integrase